MKFKELETNRLFLRRFKKEDINFIYTHFSNKDVSKYLYDSEPPGNIDEANCILEWCMDFNSERHIRWCILLKKGLKPIGTCGFHNYDIQNNSAEIGYDLSNIYWNKGYMSEALKKMLLYGFDDLCLNRIYACVYVENIRSNKLLEKSGFTLEGIIRDKHLFRGKYYDHNLFSLLKRERSECI
ncbi:MAG: GNAT family N-acetyltransferase [Spirochaetales bacterium]|nr:GNAT family N-acetyltransferase [Spirochaetales bacterium]